VQVKESLVLATVVDVLVPTAVAVLEFLSDEAEENPRLVDPSKVMRLQAPEHNTR
jgi:hypothetical protein